jgi:hypothetical protein
VKRREQLEALKRGFVWAADLRPALQLFGGGEALHTLYHRRGISMLIITLGWLRFTYVLRCWC